LAQRQHRTSWYRRHRIDWSWSLREPAVGSIETSSVSEGSNHEEEGKTLNGDTVTVDPVCRATQRARVKAIARYSSPQQVLDRAGVKE